MNIVIPKSLRKQKLTIWKELTCFDLFLGFLYAAIAFGISYGANSLGTLVQIVIFIIIFLLMSLTFFKSKKLNLKFYEIIYYTLVFYSQKNKYKANLKNYLFNYVKIEDNILISTDANKKQTRKTYSIAFELKGLNISILEDAAKENLIISLKEILNTFDFSFDLIKTNEKINLSKTIDDYYAFKTKISTNNNLSTKQKSQRLFELTNTLEMLVDGATVFDYDSGIKYYLVIHSHQLETLKDYSQIIANKFKTIRINCNLLNKYQFVNLLNKVYNPFNDEISNEQIDSNSENLAKFFNFQDIEFNHEYIKFQNGYSKINLIYEFPMNPNFLWLNFLFSCDYTTIYKSRVIPKEDSNKLFHKANLNQKVNLLTTNKIMDSVEKEQALNTLNDLIQNIAAKTDDIRYTNIYFVLANQNKKELLNENKKFTKQCKDEGFLINELNLRQQTALKAISLNGNLLFANEAYEIPNSAFAFGFPFTSNALVDPNGFYLGSNNTNNVLFWNRFEINEKRKNHNMFVIATAGSGKSTLLKRIIRDDLIKNRFVMVLDIEREYKHMAIEWDGQWIELGSGSGGVINPLQVLSLIKDDDESTTIDKTIMIDLHIDRLLTWFELLFVDISEDIKRYLAIMLKHFYLDWFKLVKDLEKVKAEKMPIFSDFYHWLKKHQNNQVKQINFKKHFYLMELINDQLIEGSYASIYNKHQDIVVGANWFTVIDIHYLKNRKKNLVQAQLYLALAVLEDTVLKISKKYHKTVEISTVVDEAHWLMDRNNPAGLDYLFFAAKTYRKRKAGITIATQNPKDMTETEELIKKTSAILNNSQYHFFMGLTPNDVEHVNRLYETIGGLTQEEKKVLTQGIKGKGILIISPTERYLFDSDIQPHEWMCIDPEKRELGGKYES